MIKRITSVHDDVRVRAQWLELDELADVDASSEVVADTLAHHPLHF